MSFDLENFQDASLDADYVTYLVDQHGSDSAAHLNKLWDYFRNPFIPGLGLAADALNANCRPYFQAQEVGLPARITGVDRSGSQNGLTDLRRKEVVIENDIAWRIHTMIDFLFGRAPAIRSLAPDRQFAAVIEKVIAAMLEANGGIALLQEMSMLGAVYGFVDIALRTPAEGIAVSPATAPRAAVPPAGGPSLPSAVRPGTSGPTGADESAVSVDGTQDPGRDRSKLLLDRAVAMARNVQLETVEAPRVLPILEEDDYRRVRYWAQRFYKHPARLAENKRPWYNLGWSSRRSASPAVVEVIEILGPSWWQRYEDRALVAEGPNLLGRVPVVHVQNIASPGTYEGLSDVEPLIPLQDELNTRLSDRANRVTYQSFKMYLGKGIDDFLERPVGPGQMWATQNLSASIEEFGSDSGSPSEDVHIEQVRSALDKVSGVTPLAAGLIRGSVGNLTSATALKVLLGGLLAKTEKKRLTYGRGLQQVVELALDWLDRTGALRTREADRQIEIHWPSPVPADEGEQLRNLQIKAQLGVPAERILAELGYDRQTINQPQ